jgi:hypothetical protein
VSHGAGPLISGTAYDRWSTLGPCKRRQGLAAGVLQPGGERVQLVREQVPIHVQGDARVAWPSSMAGLKRPGTNFDEGDELARSQARVGGEPDQHPIRRTPHRHPSTGSAPARRGAPTQRRACGAGRGRQLSLARRVASMGQRSAHRRHELRRSSGYRLGRPCGNEFCVLPPEFPELLARRRPWPDPVAA